MKLTHQTQFVNKIRQALNQSTAHLPDAYLHRLATARKAALRMQKAGRHVVQWKTQSAIGGLHATDNDQSTKWIWGWVVSLLFIVSICLFEFYQVEQQNHIDEIAAIDADMLIDELPISAYADYGFNAFLKKDQ